MATLLDVAQKAGVSKTTAATICRGNGDLYAPATRAAVLQAARELGYAPNPHAQKLARGRANNAVAIFTPSLDMATTVPRVQHIQNLLEQRGFTAQLWARPYESRLESGNVELLRSIRLEKPRALIINAGWHFGGADNDEVRRFQDEGGHVVLMAHNEPFDLSCDQVVFDGANVLGLGLRHLVELGHRDIGMAGHNFESDGSARAAMVRLMDKIGLELRPEWILAAPKHFNEAAGLLGAQRFLELKNRPTAVIANEDSVATSFLNTLWRAGVRVPDELSLFCTRDSPRCQHAIVPLSAVSDSSIQQAQRVAELLLERLDGLQSPPRIEWVRGDFIGRDSSAKPTF